MKSEELRHASPGFYLVDEGYDLVLNADSPIRTSEDALREANRLHARTARIYLVRQVLQLADPWPACPECGRTLDEERDGFSPMLCVRCRITRLL